MGGAHHCSAPPLPPPVSEMTYTVPSGTLNPSIPYNTSSGGQWCNEDFFQDQDLNFKTKTKTLKFFQDQDQA